MRPSDRKSGGQSPLPFPERELLAVRLLPAEFARAIGVSKQSVSRWVRDSKVTLGADGRLNPNEGMRQLMRNCDPGRIRARLFRQAFTDLADVRADAARAAILDEQVAELRANLQAADLDYDQLAGVLEGFRRALLRRESDLRATPGSAEWERLVGEILATEQSREDEDILDLAGLLGEEPSRSTPFGEGAGTQRGGGA